ncbi:MAG: hypothetical protein HOK99_01440 [Betaproteobacteria bacterium]|nr:hypothetical protein [Betaproteobacteria bacterium]
MPIYNPGTLAYDLLNAVEGLSFDTFPHHYGSWSNLFGSVVVSKDFAQVVVPNRKAESIMGDPDFDSAEDRLARYPAYIADPCRKWGSRWGILDALSHENCNWMQLGRVFFENDAHGVVEKKKESFLADMLYGVPRQCRVPPSPVERGALPRGGWNTAFKNILYGLKSSGVEVRFQSPAKIHHMGERLSVSLRGETLPADVIVWCANPNPVARVLNAGPLDSIVSKMINVLFEAQGHLPCDPFYSQVFSLSSPITRIFSYRKGDKDRLTVEAFDNGCDLEKLTSDVRCITSDFGWDVRLKPVKIVPERRFVVVTSADQNRFGRIEKLASNFGLITGGWQNYGRDPRINHIFRRLQEVGAF